MKSIRLMSVSYTHLHTYRPYMKGVINPYGSTRNPVTNDVLNPREKMIKEEGDKYLSLIHI